MGNFIGHIIPGSLFIIFSILWTINLLRYYFTRKLKHTLNDELQFEFKKFHKPMESLILVFLLPIAIMGEYFTAWESPDNLMTPDNLQHMTMYLFFFISSIANLLEFYSYSPLPSFVDPLYGFAFGAETLLLYFHIHGQGLVEQHLHKLLLLAAFMCSISSFLSGIVKNDVVVQLAKPLFVLLQGTWFCQIGFMLYPIFELHPTKHQHHHNHSVNVTNNHTMNHITMDHLHDHHNLVHEDPHAHRNIMITTAYFCWHFALCLITIFTLAVICRKKYFKPNEGLNQKYQRLLEETQLNDDQLKPVC